jgi:hypothetical protein
VTDSFGNQGVSANISVTINAAPSVGITGPVAGTLLAVGVPQTVTATADRSTSGVTIVSVQFFANGEPLGTDTTAPYGVAWTPPTAGRYTLTAIATDSGNVTATSPGVLVLAGAAPSIAISAPVAGATVGVNSTTTVTATASSPNGSIASVQSQWCFSQYFQSHTTPRGGESDNGSPPLMTQVHRQSPGQTDGPALIEPQPAA